MSNDRLYCHDINVFINIMRDNTIKSSQVFYGAITRYRITLMTSKGKMKEGRWMKVLTIYIESAWAYTQALRLVK